MRKRRGISLNGLSYQRLKDYCDSIGASVAGFVETLVAEKLDAAGVPIPTAVDPPKKRTKRRKDSADDGGQHFTF